MLGTDLLVASRDLVCALFRRLIRRGQVVVDRSASARWRVIGHSVLVVCLALAIAAASACGPAEPARRALTLSGPSMGTTWTVTVVAGTEGVSDDESRAIDREIRDVLGRVEGLMSTWDRESELSRFNASDDLEPFPVAPETFDVFRWSRVLWDETGGVLDPTIAPLVEAWGFGPSDRSQPVPDEPTIERLRRVVGMTLVELDPGGAWVRKRQPGVRVDFSALAPGYAADLVAARLTARGLTDFLIDVSGELVARGRNAHGQVWQVGVERPQAEGSAVARVVPLLDGAMATSGDYRNVRDEDGARLTHILDPRSGRPVHHALASVTVFDDLAVRADALATALMVLGPDDGPAFAERQGLAALFLVRQPGGSFEERTTTAFKSQE